jgi:hypothetical protein
MLIVIDNLPVKVNGLERALQMSDSAVIHHSYEMFCPSGNHYFDI